MTKKNIFDLIEEDENSFLYTLDGFELELYNILEIYFSKDKFILSWNPNYMNTFIKYFSENYMKITNGLDPINCSPYEIELYKEIPYKIDFYMEEVYGYNFPYEHGEGDRFKFLDIFVKEFQQEFNKNSEADRNEVLKKLRVKAEKIIQFEKAKIENMAKIKIEQLRNSIPKYYDMEFVSYRYGFPLATSVIVYRHSYEQPDSECRILLGDLLKH